MTLDSGPKPHRVGLGPEQRVIRVAMFVFVFLKPHSSPYPHSGPYNCHKPTVWLGRSVVRVLARYARGPGFESRSGHVPFPPL